MTSMQNQPDPETLAQELVHSYAYLMSLINLLDTDELAQTCLPGGWSPKALLAHVAFWDAFQTQRMQAALAGKGPEKAARPQVDNEALAAQAAKQPWDAVVAEANRNRQQLIDFARACTQAQIEALYWEDGKQRALLHSLLPHMAQHAYEHAAEIKRYLGSLDRWGRKGLRALLQRQHANLLDGIGGLHEETVTRTPVCGEWSVRDLLAHVLAWDEYTLAVMRHRLNPKLAELAHWQGETQEAINARIHAEAAELGMIEILDALATVHRRTLHTFDQLDDASLRQEGDYAGGRTGALSGFLFEMAHHTAEHAAQIWAARAAGVLPVANVEPRTGPLSTRQ